MSRKTGGLYVLLAFLGGRARNTERGGQTDQLISAAQQSAVYRAVDKHDQISALCRVTGSLLPRRRRRCCFISRWKEIREVEVKERPTIVRNRPIQIGYFRQFNGLRQVRMISKRYK